VNYSYSVSSQPRLQRCFVSLISAGCAIALSSCTGDGTAPSTQTIAYDGLSELDIQPIQVCDDQGRSCARVNIFEDITTRILEQAQLRVNFLPTNQLNGSRFLSLSNSGSNNEFYEISRSGEPGDYGRHEDSTRTTGPINVWFVDEIESSSSATQFGAAWVDANGVVISSETLDFNNGEGRIDTLAHEIGHNLGLRHTTFGAGGKENLLTDGNTRLTPRSIDDIGESGAGLSTLTDAQIAEIQNSGFLRGVEGEADTDVVLSDLSLLADAAGSATTAPFTDSFEGAVIEGTLIGGAVSTPQATGLQPAGGRSGGAEQVPEPASFAGIAILGLAVLINQKKQSLENH